MVLRYCSPHFCLYLSVGGIYYSSMATTTTSTPCLLGPGALHARETLWAFQAWDEKDATAVEEEFSLEDLFGDDEPAKVEL